MEIVQRRDAATLLPIIQAHTAPGSIVHSDDWAAYHTGVYTSWGMWLPTMLSLHFVDPVTGVHTQNVESYWNRVKTKSKRMKGCHAGQLQSYLDEFLWRERYGKTGGEAWNNIISDIAAQYPV